MGEAKVKEVARKNGRMPGCGSCNFFRRIQLGQAMGHCRARPPTLVLLGMNANHKPVTDTFWPMVPDHEWCGEFEVRPSFGEIDFTELDAVPVEGTA
jgi:hypothetical protein